VVRRRAPRVRRRGRCPCRRSVGVPTHGVYKDAGAPGDQFDDMRAAWLSIDPKRLSYDRSKDRANDVVFSGASAARLHGIGELWDRQHDFIAPTPRQSQRTGIHHRLRKLDPRDVTTVEGLMEPAGIDI